MSGANETDDTTEWLFLALAAMRDPSEKMKICGRKEQIVVERVHGHQNFTLQIRHAMLNGTRMAFHGISMQMIITKFLCVPLEVKRTRIHIAGHAMHENSSSCFFPDCLGKASVEMTVTFFIIVNVT